MAKHPAQKLSDIALAEAPEVAKEWLSGVKPKLDALMALATSGNVSDSQFITALKRASSESHEWFDLLNTEVLSEKLYRDQFAILAGADTEIRDSKRVLKAEIKDSEAL